MKIANNQIDSYIQKIAQENISLILISHDISAVTSHVQRVICLNHSILYDGLPTASEFHSCLHKIYGEESYIHDHRNNH